jgi:preprotein translocase subunit YajC
MMNIISVAHAADTAQVVQPGVGMPQMLVMGAFAIVFYFLMIRPQAKRAKQHRNLITNLTLGDEVVAGGGILGKITKLDDSFLTLQVGDNTQFKVQRVSVVAVMPKGTLKAS